MHTNIRQTSAAFKPRVPAGSLNFSLAQSKYLPVKVSPCTKNRSMSPSAYVTPLSPGQAHSNGLTQEQVWCTRILVSENIYYHTHTNVYVLRYINQCCNWVTSINLDDLLTYWLKSGDLN